VTVLCLSDRLGLAEVAAALVAAATLRNHQRFAR
jgi:hypothetical protein